MSTTYTTSSTFTRTDAQYVASKLAADLWRLQRLYGRPSDSEIEDYVIETIILLAGDYLDWVEYGFKSANRRLITLRYEARYGSLASDDNAGSVYARAEVAGASRYSFLTYSEKYLRLSPEQQASILAEIPVDRTAGRPPEDGDGYWVSSDGSYSRHGSGTVRSVFRPV